MSLHDILYSSSKNSSFYEDIKSGISYPTYYSDVVESRKIMPQCIGSKFNLHRVCYNIPNSEFSNYGIANINIVGDWDKVAFEIGGFEVDRIHKDSRRTKFNMTNNYRCIPFAFAHSMSLRFWANSFNAHIMYDIVKISGNTPTELNFPVIQQCYFGSKHIEVSGRHFIKTECSQYPTPTQRLIVVSNMPLANVVFRREREEDVNGGELSLRRITTGEWAYDFGDRPVVLSGSASNGISFDTNETGTVHIFGDVHNYMIGRSGRYSLKYSC